MDTADHIPAPSPPPPPPTTTDADIPVHDDERDRLVDNVAGHLRDGVSPAECTRANDYWRWIDPPTGDRIADRLHVGQAGREADS